MKPHIRMTLALLLLTAVPAVTISFACSVLHVDSAAEITDGADVILLVKVPDVTITNISPMKMAVMEVVKGQFNSKTVTVQGQTARYEGRNDESAPFDFVREGGRHGNCFASDYKSGGQFLLFLKGGEVHWSPLAATNEEVSGPKDAWVIWVKNRLRTK